uniref:Putative secreted protein n=1 Tax=Ixodes ricinus TaxID=34613 RepID=A0A6B0UX13_IXORI
MAFDRFLAFVSSLFLSREAFISLCCPAIMRSPDLAPPFQSLSSVSSNEAHAIVQAGARRRRLSWTARRLPNSHIVAQKLPRTKADTCTPLRRITRVTSRNRRLSARATSKAARAMLKRIVHQPLTSVPSKNHWKRLAGGVNLKWPTVLWLS